MKKLVLMTTVAVMALAVPAHATGKTYHTKTYDNNQETYRLDVQNEPNMKVETRTTTRTELRPAGRQEFALTTGGERIIVNGEAVYLRTASGMTYPAPKGSYETTNGFTIVSDNGKWLRTEGPQETVYVDIDADNDGRADTVRTYR